MKKLCLLFIIPVLWACEADNRKRAKREELNFTTTADAQLFFKNLRRTDYDYENMVAARLDVFRHAERNLQANYPILFPALVINRQYDEAYLLLEANEALGSISPLQIAWQDKTQQQQGQFALDSHNKMEQLRFADQLYHGLRQGHQFFLLQDSLRLPFLNQPADRRIFRTIMTDYYKLTGTQRP